MTESSCVDPKSPKAAIGIVTVTYNSAQVLPEFFRSLETQTFTNFHVWAVDNASQDNSVTQFESWEYGQSEVICSATNVGVAAGNNIGIKAALAAGCDYVLLMNNDVLFGPNLLQGLLDGLAERHCDMVVPLTFYADPPNMIWFAGGVFRTDFGNLPTHVGFREIDCGNYRTATQIEYAPTCCTLIRREVFDQIGMMDERYFVYLDDTDFMFRAWRAGLVTYYLPDLVLWHKVSSLAGEDTPFSQRYLMRNRAFFIKKYSSRWSCLRLTLMHRLWLMGLLIRAKDDWKTFVRKQRAWSEGLRIQ